MKIIGHRGAAGLAPENTIPAIQKGLSADADVIEVDIRQTLDGKIVLSHDSNLKRVYGADLKISAHTLNQLRASCPNLPTLDQVLQILTNKMIIIEVKEFIEPDKIFKILQKYPKVKIKFSSFNHRVIREIKKHSPASFCYVLEHHSPFEIINHASKMKADGIGLNYGVINPLTYFLARRKNLHIYVYTLNKLWIAKILKFFYRSIDICTDDPSKLKTLKS